MMYESAANANETPGLEDYLTAIRQRKWLVLICALLGLFAASFFIQSRSLSYTASSKVLVNPTNVGTVDLRLSKPVLEREREVVASNSIAEAVAEQLGISASSSALLRDLDVDFIDDSDSLELKYTSSDPEVAQETVNAFATSYVNIRLADAANLDLVTIAELRMAVEAIDEQIAELTTALDELSRERAALIASGQNASLAQDQLTDVRGEISSLRNDRRVLNIDLTDAEIAQNTRTPPAAVLQFASVPSVPNGFSSRILQVLGLFLGIGGGISLAFVLHRLDRTARESADVELALGTSVLASVPPFGLGHRGGTSAVVMLSAGRSTRIQQARESFRRLRSALRFLGASREASSFLITSARPSEGKSTTAANLAVALSQSDASVCLVDADLRRPTLAKILGIPNHRGIADWLVDPTITDIMVPVPGAPNLVLVPSGTTPPNPGELLATGRIGELVAELTEQYEIVIVDAPPVLSAADASAIAPSVDGTIVVVDASRTDTDTLLRVRAELDRAGGTVLGAVLNRDRSDTGIRLRRDRYAYEKVSASRSSQ